MRSFVPAKIFKMSVESLAAESGYSHALCKRLMKNKCLWLVRMHEGDIGKIHASDLTGKFNPTAIGLDIVEMGALLASLPESFIGDSDGRKLKLRQSIEMSFKSLWKRQEASHKRDRHAAYQNQIPAYRGRETLHSLDVSNEVSRRSSTATGTAGADGLNLNDDATVNPTLSSQTPHSGGKLSSTVKQLSKIFEATRKDL
jgi:hypothetical protein